MKVVCIDKAFIEACCEVDDQMLMKVRPCVILVRMRYKGRNCIFAVPLRSNLKSNIPRDQYLPLPPTCNTKPHNRAGIHFIKAFPIKKCFIRKWWGLPDETADIIDDNGPEIVNGLIEHLRKMEEGTASPYSVDIDKILNIIDNWDN